MILDTFSIKELYDISIKSTSIIEIGGRTFEPGETILFLDSAQFVLLTEEKIHSTSRGGFSNSALITWDNTKSISFDLEKGISSKVGYSLLANSKIKEDSSDTMEIPMTQTLETDENGIINLKFIPLSKEFFLYDEDMNKLTTGYTVVDKNISGLAAFKEYTIRYLFVYVGDASVLSIGQRLFSGYFKLTAKTRLKDDSDGHTKTGILEIPHVRLMSDLSMRLGENVTAYVSRFRLQGDPVGERTNQYVAKLIFLETDLEADL